MEETVEEIGKSEHSVRHERWFKDVGSVHMPMPKSQNKVPKETFPST